MTEQSKLIIRGSGKILYLGVGTIEQWKEKLGEKLEYDSYSLTQIEILDLGLARDLQITNQAFLKNQQDGQYYSVGINRAQCNLDRESKSLLLELINESPEQLEQARR